ncbi:cytochrome P450 [Lactarius hengduanensis]|nr:cytochrome P450 [Lactarius hengduanensis]
MFLTWFLIQLARIIPEETQLCLHTYSIHRDPRNFHTVTPEAFLPERWLSTGAPVGEHNTAAFFPFSYGPTICVGKNLALMEMRMVLCWVLRRFRFSSAPGYRQYYKENTVGRGSGVVYNVSNISCPKFQKKASQQEDM